MSPSSKQKEYEFLKVSTYILSIVAGGLAAHFGGFGAIVAVVLGEIAMGLFIFTHRT